MKTKYKSHPIEGGNMKIGWTYTDLPNGSILPRAKLKLIKRTDNGLVFKLMNEEALTLYNINEDGIGMFPKNTVLYHKINH